MLRFVAVGLVVMACGCGEQPAEQPKGFFGDHQPVNTSSLVPMGDAAVFAIIYSDGSMKHPLYDHPVRVSVKAARMVGIECPSSPSGDVLLPEHMDPIPIPVGAEVIDGKWPFRRADAIKETATKVRIEDFPGLPPLTEEMKAAAKRAAEKRK